MKIIRTRQRPFLVVIDALFTVLAWLGLLYLLVNGLWPLFDSQAGPRLGGQHAGEPEEGRHDGLRTGPR